MRTIDTIVIGAGQAGLAASNCLARRRHDHVVLERGRIGERWHAETWDSLHLLTPNWANGLPGWDYDGHDPDGFMGAREFAAHLAAYAESFDAPVEGGTTIEAVRRHGDQFEVRTDAGTWLASNVILATGWCDRPAIPAMARRLAAHVHQVAPAAYRNPGDLPAGGVLVVGASATGVQLADELRAAGREVTLAVGGHSRIPRRYRGMDIFWWLRQIGVLDKTIDDMPDPHSARREPSLQLVGRPDHRSLDLAALQAAGVRLVGRVIGIDGHRVRLADDLASNVAAADARLTRVLTQIDRHVEEHGLSGEVLRPTRPRPVAVARTTERIDLRADGITSVVWATGHRRPYEWLHIPVLDRRGELRQRRGVTPVPGLYVLGQRFQHRRSSNFIGGVGRDAEDVAAHLARRTATSIHPSSLPAP